MSEDTESGAKINPCRIKGQYLVTDDNENEVAEINVDAYGNLRLRSLKASARVCMFSELINVASVRFDI